MKIFSWFRERLQRKFNPKKTLTVNNCPESEKDLMARWQFIRSEVKAIQSTNAVHMARGNAAKFYGLSVIFQERMFKIAVYTDNILNAFQNENYRRYRNRGVLHNYSEISMNGFLNFKATEIFNAEVESLPIGNRPIKIPSHLV